MAEYFVFPTLISGEAVIKYNKVTDVRLSKEQQESNNQTLRTLELWLRALDDCRVIKLFDGTGTFLVECTETKTVDMIRKHGLVRRITTKKAYSRLDRATRAPNSPRSKTNTEDHNKDEDE